MEYDPLEPEFRLCDFRDGQLHGYVTCTSQCFRIAGWPSLRTEYQQRDGNWHEANIEVRDKIYLEIGSYRHPRTTRYTRLTNSIEDAWLESVSGQIVLFCGIDETERYAALAHYFWQLFDRTVPASVVSGLTRARTDYLSLLILIKEAPLALDLAAHDPLLLVALARHWEFPAVGRVDWPAVQNLMRQPRKAILGWLGFPPIEAAVKALRRYALPTSNTQNALTGIRAYLELLQEPETGATCIQLPKVDSTLVSLMKNPRSRHWFTARQMARLMRLDPMERQDAYFRISQLQQFSELELLDPQKIEPADLNPRRRLGSSRLLQMIKDHHLYPAPLTHLSPGVKITQILWTHDLIREGEVMHHCVGSADYIGRALKNEIAIYRVTRPERATLALAFDKMGGWQIEELLGFENHPLSSEDFVLICSGLQLERDHYDCLTSGMREPTEEICESTEPITF